MDMETAKTNKLRIIGDPLYTPNGVICNGNHHPLGNPQGIIPTVAYMHVHDVLKFIVIHMSSYGDLHCKNKRVSLTHLIGYLSCTRIIRMQFMTIHDCGMYIKVDSLI